MASLLSEAFSEALPSSSGAVIVSGIVLVGLVLIFRPSARFTNSINWKSVQNIGVGSISEASVTKCSGRLLQVISPKEEEQQYKIIKMITK